MKRNDITALHTMSVSELQSKLAGLQKDLATARLQNAVGKLANVSLITRLADDIARIKTVQREQELKAKN